MKLNKCHISSTITHIYAINDILPFTKVSTCTKTTY